MKELLLKIKQQSLPIQIHGLGCLLIIIGLFFSRALMSIGMMTLVLAALAHSKRKNNWKDFIHNTPYVLMSLYAIIMAFTFFWSTDLKYYVQRMTIMLPFLVLPFSFLSFRNETHEWLKPGLILFLVFLTIGNSISLFTYFSQKDLFDASYGFSKVIPTPFKSDHIRYSMAVAIGCAVILFYGQQAPTLISKILWGGLFLYFTVFIHILSSKTGVLSYYLVCLTFLFYLFRKKQNRKFVVGLLLLLMLIPVISYRFSSTFRSKISYLEYSFHEIGNNHLQANVSDEGRIISYQYAFDILKKQPLLGVGLGDVYKEMDWRFKRDFPERTEEPLLPHNQFLMVWVGGGLLACLYLVYFQWRWITRVLKFGFLHVAVFLVLFFGMLFEPLFETQYGACIYVIIILFIDKSPSNMFKLNEMNKSDCN